MYMLSSGRRAFRGMSRLLPVGSYLAYRRGTMLPKPLAGMQKSLPTRSRVVKRAPARKMPVRAKKPRTNFAQRIKSLEARERETMSKLIYKYDNVDRIKPTVGAASYGFNNAVSSSQIEAAIAQCRFFDPSAPGTLITGSLATPTYFQNICVSVSSSMVISNNYQVPCVVTAGVVRPKHDTNITPYNAFTNGLADIGNPDNLSTLVSFYDSPQFRDLWYGKLKAYKIMPGKTVVIKHFQKQFNYDPSFNDSHNQTYQKAHKSAVYLYRVQGVLGHDTSVATETAIMPAGIDCYFRSTYIITYNSGGASIKTIVLAENASQSFTNGGVVSQIVVDNQAYSVS